jgi:ribokinase
VNVIKKIIVLGSINMDLVASVDRAPEGGETISGLSFHTFPGGKGANQAVAVSRQGGNPVMIAKLGIDVFGDDLISKLAQGGVEVDRIKRCENISSGVALIMVEKNGQNRIIVIAGANGQLNPIDVDEASDLFSQSDYLICQLETPIATVQHSLVKAKAHQIKTVVNLSPVPECPLNEAFLKQIDYLVINEHEAQAITGISITDKDSGQAAAQILQRATRGIVIITLGSMGAITADEKVIWHTPAFKVNAIDTTAAGDAFIGGLVTALQRGSNLEDAITHANAAGALAACRMGAQPSIPTYQETISFLSTNFLEG